MDCSVNVAETKALISCVVTVQLICAFVFAPAKFRHSHGAAHIAFSGVEIFKAGEEKIHKIFLDPTGRHLIISLVSTENFYLSRNSKKAKPIGRLKVSVRKMI